MIAACVLVGAVWGAMRHQSTIGLLVGLSVGVVLALAVWLFDRRRQS